MSNGCWGRAPLPKLIPLKAEYPLEIQGHIVMAEGEELIPNVFSKRCEYTKTALGRADKGCFKNDEPCKWRDE